VADGFGEGCHDLALDGCELLQENRRAHPLGDRDAQEQIDRFCRAEV
jgi:hypothetical protein